jgi:predicted house-cleaning NTP pyrophosphatase (Maf/HAM1 superfamily)
LIAPDTVTYLDGRTVGKPASKAKPDSGIKHYSDLK